MRLHRRPFSPADAVGLSDGDGLRGCARTSVPGRARIAKMPTAPRLRREAKPRLVGAVNGFTGVTICRDGRPMAFMTTAASKWLCTRLRMPFRCDWGCRADRARAASARGPSSTTAGLLPSTSRRSRWSRPQRSEDVRPGPATRRRPQSAREDGPQRHPKKWPRNGIRTRCHSHNRRPTATSSDRRSRGRAA